MNYIIAWSLHGRECLASRSMRADGSPDVFLARRYAVGEKPQLRFPRYVFAACDMSDEEINTLGRSRGVEQIVKGAGGKVYQVKASVIEKFRDIEDEEFELLRSKSKVASRTDLAIGDIVQVSEKGVWWGVKGSILSHAHGKAFVLLGAVVKEFLDCDLKKVVP